MTVEDTGTVTPKYDPTAYELGCIARQHRQGKTACEYPEGHLRDSWMAGWQDVHQAQQDLAREQAKAYRPDPPKPD